MYAAVIQPAEPPPTIRIFRGIMRFSSLYRLSLAGRQAVMHNKGASSAIKMSFILATIKTSRTCKGNT
jgi:hypothetical protein